jgi:hypothetical protein
MSTIAVNAITNAAGGNTATINGMTPTADSLQGFRNRIINGDMRIDQRNAGAAVTIVNDANQYTTDRWQVVESSSCVLSAQQVTDAPSSFQNSLKITVTTAAGSVGASEIGIVEQRLEGFNTADFAFGSASASSVTLSFWVKSSITGSFSGSLRNGGSNRAYPFSYTISAANTWEQKSVTIAGDTTGTWVTNNGIGIRLAFDIGSGSSRRGTANAWAASNLDGVTGAASIVTTLNATWQVTGVQLEAGSVATPFERRPYGTELALCQRYYYRITGVNNLSSISTGSVDSGGTTTLTNGTVSFPVTMRTAPTALEQSGTETDYRTRENGSNFVCTGVPTYIGSTTNTASVQYQTTGGTLGRASIMRFQTSSGFLAWSAEL